MAQKTPNTRTKETSGDDAGNPSIKGSSNDFVGGRFLTRAQRNQAAFAKGVTGRCGCKEEGCVDCTNHEMWSRLLDSDAGVGSSEH
jgi:hypothetical protein